MNPCAELSHIPAALAAIRRRIEAASHRAGRAAGSVTLIAVSKTYGAEAVQAAVAAGQIHFGENRVQEAAAKFGAQAVTGPTLHLHLIGALQTNKAEQAATLATVIESLDRPALADALARAADRRGLLPELLVQVNIGDEPQKSGVPVRDADQFIGECRARFGARLTGLMCIPPAGADPAPHFDRLAAMAAAHGLGVLSMGMSGDFEAAIAAGATHVRIGSAIFGARPAASPTFPQTR